MSSLDFQVMLMSVRLSLIPPERYYTDVLSQTVKLTVGREECGEGIISAQDAAQEPAEAAPGPARPVGTETQDSAQRVPWWRRMFGR